MKHTLILLVSFLMGCYETYAFDPTTLVNPFIGTTNFGTCNPGAVVPQGMMSATPFNVMGSDLNHYDKDARWWSTPYDNTNSYFTGYSHVNLSGVGCPDLASLLLMPTSGTLDVDYHNYGSTYTAEEAHPGYYTNRLTKYGITTEVTATERTSRARFTFPAGTGHILLNLGEGLTNESGAWVRYVSDTEIEGQKMLGNFCYNSPRAYYPIYYVVRVNRAPASRGFWKHQRDAYGVEKEWNPEAGRYKLYDGYRRDLAGDDIGAYWNYDLQAGEQVEVSIGVSFVSVENARLNLNTEQPASATFDALRRQAHDKWQKALSTIEIEGGTPDERTVFYTALYHTLIHPNILNDVNGEYPLMETEGVGRVNSEQLIVDSSKQATVNSQLSTLNSPLGDARRRLPEQELSTLNSQLSTLNSHFTVFSLWDTYRCTHQLFTLLWPDRQEQMLQSMLQMYRESGWLPKWELYGRETFTMEGDPAIPVFVDSWLKGLRGFDIEEAYAAMRKGAVTPGKDNPLRPDNDDYMRLGYCPLLEQYDNSVSHALEYYVADAALANLADALGKKDDARLFRNRSLGYKKYYSPEYGTLRPLLPDGTFLSPFNPKQGENFEPSPGFHEGNAWNYTFYVPHDIPGLCRLMGGKKKFVSHLQSVFDRGNYDPANEPDIAYPYLFSRWTDEAWRTQKLTRELLRKYFRNAPDGIPGNDDTGTMSAWAVFSMLGLYPDCPGQPYYTLTAPVFEKATLHIPGGDLVISAPGAADNYRVSRVLLGGKALKSYRISHADLLRARNLSFSFQVGSIN